MASMVPSAAALPSGSARRLGSGILSLAALPGHGSAVLTDRRVWTGYGEELTVGFKASARDVKAACAKTGSEDAEGDADDLDKMQGALSEKQDMLVDIAERWIELCGVKAGSDDPDTLVKEGGEIDDLASRNLVQDFDKTYDDFIASLEKLNESGELLKDLPLSPAAASDKEKAVQEKLAEIAERCINLQADAMRRLSLKQKLKVYNFFWPVHLGFATVAAAAKEGRCGWELAVGVIADNLEAVRKMVSHACATPLPLPRVVIVPRLALEEHLPTAFSGAYCTIFDRRFTAIDSGEGAMLAMLEKLYKAAKSDINCTIKDAAAQ